MPITIKSNLDMYSILKKVNLRYNGERGVEQALEDVKTEAMGSTPVDTGLLRSSFRIDVSSDSGSSIRGSLTNETPYSIFVHERLDVYHPIGKAKYLEDPFLERAFSGKILKTIANHIGKDIK